MRISLYLLVAFLLLAYVSASDLTRATTETETATETEEHAVAEAEVVTEAEKPTYTSGRKNLKGAKGVTVVHDDGYESKPGTDGTHKPRKTKKNKRISTAGLKKPHIIAEHHIRAIPEHVDYPSHEYSSDRYEHHEQSRHYGHNHHNSYTHDLDYEHHPGHLFAARIEREAPLPSAYTTPKPAPPAFFAPEHYPAEPVAKPTSTFHLGEAPTAYSVPGISNPITSDFHIGEAPSAYTVPGVSNPIAADYHIGEAPTAYTPPTSSLSIPSLTPTAPTPRILSTPAPSASLVEEQQFRTLYNAEVAKENTLLAEIDRSLRTIVSQGRQAHKANVVSVQQLRNIKAGTTNAENTVTRTSKLGRTMSKHAQRLNKLLTRSEKVVKKDIAHEGPAFVQQVQKLSKNIRAISKATKQTNAALKSFHADHGKKYTNAELKRYAARRASRRSKITAKRLTPKNKFY